MPKPVITAGNSSIAWGQSVLAGSLFGVTDADGDPVTAYELWDSGTAGSSGYFSLSGVRQATQASIPVSAAGLADARFVGGTVAGAETVWVRALAGGEWSEWLSWQMSTTGNAPVVSATSRGIHPSQSVAASSLFTATDAEGNGTITQYQFWDEGTDSSSGYFAVSGVRRDAGGAITISAAELAQTTYVGGALNGAETVWVRANDGSGWGTWVAWVMTTGNALPVAAAVNGAVNRNQSVAAGSLFSVSDADGDAITQYRFWDEGTAGSSGYFSLSGTRQVEGAGFDIAAADLANLQWVGGSAATAEVVWVRAHDGVDFGAWVSWTMTTVAPVNHLPVASAVNASVNRNQAVAAGSLFSVSDADGDAITQYRFWDEGTAGSSGYFSLSGVRQVEGAGFNIAAADLANLQWIGGSAASAEVVWVRAHDGTDFGAWVSWTMTTVAPVNHLPVTTPTAASHAMHAGQTVAASSLFSATDADADTITQYRFWDEGTAGSSGYFSLSGNRQVEGAGFNIAAADLANLQWFAGSTATSEVVWVRASDGADFGPWASWTMSTHNAKPVSVPTASDQRVAKNQALSASSLFSATDADGDLILDYEFWDSGASGGYFEYLGEDNLLYPQSANVAIRVNALTIMFLRYRGGAVAGSETVWVRAKDNFEYGDWVSWTMTTGNGLPIVSASNASVAWGQPTAASTLFSVSDPDGDPITTFEFWDGGDAATSGYFTVNGVRQAPQVSILVNAANLVNVAFVGGMLAGSETVWVRASDGTDWGTWINWQMTTTGNAAVATASNASVGTEQSVAASTLFSATDADADTITAYEFWDGSDAATSGHFTLNGTIQPANVAISVAPSNLAQLAYVGGENPGAETLYVRANDGSGWGPWASWIMSTTIRFQEVIGTSGINEYQFGALGTDKIYFGLADYDSFQVQTGDEVMLMGGSGRDNYIAGSISGSITNIFVIVYENGNSAADWIQPGLNLDSPGAFMATIDGRHLLLGDIDQGRLVMVIDWQQPANLIEGWHLDGMTGGTLPYQLDGANNDFVEFVTSVAPPNLTIDELAAEDPGLAGFTSAVFNEMLLFYAQREAIIANNVAPVVTPAKAEWKLRSGQGVPLASLFSVSDANGDPISKYEVSFVVSGFGSDSGYLSINGVHHDGAPVVIDAAQLAQTQFVGVDITGASTSRMHVRAFDGIRWSNGALWDLTTVGNRLPMITALPTSGSSVSRKVLVDSDKSVPIGAYFRIDDADGDVIAHYRFSGNVGDLVNRGIRQTAPFTIDAEDLFRVRYEPLSSVSYLTVEAFDGKDWDEASFFVSNESNVDLLPVAAVRKLRVTPGQILPVTALFSAYDPDGDPIEQFEFSNFGSSDPNGSYLAINGVRQGFGFTIPAADLGQVTVVGGTSTTSSPLIQVWATAGGLSSQESNYIVTTTNLAPTISATAAIVNPNQSIAAISLFTATDPESDALTYTFTDLGNHPGSGYFALDGIPQYSNLPIVLAASQLGTLQYVGGQSGGIESISIAVADAVGDQVQVIVRMTTSGTIVDDAGNTLAGARLISVDASTDAFEDFVGSTDTSDYYRFSLAATSTVRLYLAGMTENLDLQLLNSSGSEIVSANKLAATPEVLSASLGSGTYYARIVPVGDAASYYTLAVNSA